MKINTLLRKIALSGGLLMMLCGVLYAPAVSAGTCGGVETAIFSCPDDFDGEGAGPDAIKKSGLMGILVVVINVMAAAVGILAVGAFVYAGFLYASAADSQERVKQAIDIIRNTVIGLALFAALYALVNFIVPGGVIG